MIAVRDRRDAWVGPKSEPENDYERTLVGCGTVFNQSEMALFFECTRQCARKLIDTADIVREAMLQQLRKK
jgi:hypothetical protein